MKIIRSEGLNLIPQNKLICVIEKIESIDCDIKEKSLKKIAVSRYYESNIPIEYWNLNMSKFNGTDNLKDIYNNYINNVKENYYNGKSFCLAGPHGIGKTMVMCNILKHTSSKGYSCLYTTLGDIVSLLTSNSGDKLTAKRELCMVDFLCIDEFDNRFLSSESSADLYGRILESIFRTRGQNKLPTLMSTNSPNILSSLTGKLKDSLESLFAGYVTYIPLLGKDFRRAQ